MGTSKAGGLVSFFFSAFHANSDHFMESDFCVGVGQYNEGNDLIAFPVRCDSSCVLPLGQAFKAM